MTPNINEFRLLCESAGVAVDQVPLAEAVEKVAERYGCVVFLKGQEDLVSQNGSACLAQNFVCGSPRRVAGQGDVFCGIVGCFAAWNRLHEVSSSVAAIGASCIMRQCAAITYEDVGPTFVASDLVHRICRAREMLLREASS
jgi:NAD(P)H-hydrate repair Nnr-like enzyme with NAD(P)H-hydrate dehydratase domain